jgi:hypothetical protein
VVQTSAGLGEVNITLAAIQVIFQFLGIGDLVVSIQLLVLLLGLLGEISEDFLLKMYVEITTAVIHYIFVLKEYLITSTEERLIQLILTSVLVS